MPGKPMVLASPMVVALLRLYRLDAALISFSAFLAGAYVSGSWTLADLGIAALVSGVSMNFVYSFNAWSDWRIDAINKPERPIPSGALSASNALRYTLALLAASLAYPPFVATGPISLALLWLLPLLGLLYSAPPRLKLYAVPAVLTTTAIHLTPMLAAYTRHTVSMEHASAFALLACYCLCVIPLKDIEDERGDIAFRSQNVAALLGARRLQLASTLGLAVVGAAIPLVDATPLVTWALAALVVTTLVTSLSFLVLRLHAHRLYRTILGVVACEGALFAAAFPWMS